MSKELRRRFHYANTVLAVALPIFLGGGFLVRRYLGEGAVQLFFLLMFFLILVIPILIEERTRRRESRDQ